MTGQQTAALALVCVVVLCIARRTLKSRASHPFPPGPPGLPWFGNVVGVDTKAPWKTFAEWARIYGDLVYSQMLGRNVIIINSEKVAKDLLENRSRNYSDRPYLSVIEMLGLGFVSVTMPYGDRWRRHRRLLHQTFRPEAVSRFLPYQNCRACHLLRRLYDTPEQLKYHLFEYTASVILNSTYDYDPTSQGDDLLEVVEKSVTIILPLMRFDNAIIIDTLPLLHLLPSWLPGMSFKRDMATAREYSKVYLQRPLEYALQKVMGGSVSPSMVHDALRHAEEDGVPPTESWMEILKDASGTAFMAASETSDAVLMTFFLMMMMNPAVQEKAQAQIDTVVGKDRLPAIDDRPSLPFVDAIYLETRRYNPVIPLSIPRAAVDDDVYDGFHIPKGTIVLPNLWSMSRDESRFPNPHAFLPERFLNDDGSLKPDDIEHITFGFGRRMCVGRHFADTSVWGVIAKVLAVFKILKPLDENGLEVDVEPEFSTGISVHPLPFRYRIVPRSPGMTAETLEQLIAASVA